MREFNTKESVQEYYGKILQTKKDLQTSACCTAEALPKHLRPLAASVHPEVTEKFYGCGSPIPDVLEGKTVLDLGSGTGRDCFILSKLVGEKGKVIGVDMTDEQLEVANRHLNYHTKLYGLTAPNIEFKKGFIEDLENLGIKSESVDVVVSNCVLNLSPNKPKVFKEIFRVLKSGGELYFSDVFADRRLPEWMKSDSVLVGECLGGALYIEDFRRLLGELGCKDYRIVSQERLQLGNPEIEQKVGNIKFYSITVRAFKLDIEDRCEDYGQVAYYLGTIPNHPHQFILDDHHILEKGRPLAVCSNTAAMLSQTRLAPHFKITGDLSTHYGIFDCGPQPARTTAQVDSDINAACC